MTVIQSESDNEETRINESDPWLAEMLPKVDTHVACNINFAYIYLYQADECQGEGYMDKESGICIYGMYLVLRIVCLHSLRTSQIKP